ncbi:MAG: type II secretion system F family protein [Dehalococcoidia bacterium]
MAYRYVAFTSSGEQVSGALDVASAEAAEQALYDQGYRIASLRPAREWPALERLFPSLFGVKAQDVITFSLQMATLAESGVAVMSALDLLERQAGGAFHRVLSDVNRAVRRGSSLSDALGEHPTVFPRMYARMVAVGERTGNLEAVLRRLAEHMERELAFVKRVRGAAAYPIFVVLLAAAVGALLVTTALPPLTSLFEEFDAGLPLPTRILLFVSKFLIAYKLWLLAGVIAFVAGAALYFRQPAGRRQFDYLLLRAPLVGHITVRANAARFSGTTAILLRAGVPMAEVMSLVIDTTPNRIVQDRLRRVRAAMLEGEGLSGPLRRAAVFPLMLVQMVETGEETGTLDANLETMAAFYTREVDERINALTSMIQPALTLIVGLVVAFIAASIIMPMYEIMQTIQSE